MDKVERRVTNTIFQIKKLAENLPILEEYVLMTSRDKKEVLHILFCIREHIDTLSENFNG